MLMAVDHKILAKVLANRIKPTLQQVISEQQTGYMQGRYIGTNIRRLMDLLHYVENENIDALLISVDFHKCFDTIEFAAVEGALKYFNYGNNFISMTKTLYNGFQASILHNGHFTEKFSPSRGLHQGCAISGYLFLLTAEILAINIRSNKTIKGITISESGDEELISQFVDDMTLAVMAQHSLQTFVV